MARRNKAGEYSYTRSAQVRGLTGNRRYAVIQRDRDRTRVVPIDPDGSAAGDGVLVPTSDVYDVRPTHVVPTGQRGTITLPGEFRRNLGIEEGTPIEITQEDDGRLSIRPLKPRREEDHSAQLEVLLQRITPANLHGEVATGEAVGLEAW